MGKNRDRYAKSIFIALVVLAPLIYLSVLVGKPVVDNNRARVKAEALFQGFEQSLSLPSSISFGSIEPHTEWGIPLLAGANWSHREPGRVHAEYILPEVTAQLAQDHSMALSDEGWSEETPSNKSKSQAFSQSIESEKVAKNKGLTELIQDGKSSYCQTHEHCQISNAELIKDKRDEPVKFTVAYRKDSYRMLLVYEFSDSNNQISYTDVVVRLILTY